MKGHEFAAWWDEAFHEGVWWAAWREAVEGLTAEEAAWKPAEGRHSIWQIVNHTIFWREYMVHRNEGGAPAAGAEELDRLDWREPVEITEEAWRQARERFAASHSRVRDALGVLDSPPPPKPQLDLRYLLCHDSYHVGQSKYIRALLGKEAIES